MRPGLRRDDRYDDDRQALPLAYNKDMQEDKEGLFDALDSWYECMEMAALCFEGIKVNKDRTLEAAMQGYSMPPSWRITWSLKGSRSVRPIISSVWLLSPR